MIKNKKSAADTPPVAVIGMGCIFPKSSDLKHYWRLIFRGIDAITEVPQTHWSPDDYYDPDPEKPDHIYCKRGGFISPVVFDPTEFGIPPNTLDATDTSQLLGLYAARAALDDAGYTQDKDFNHDRTSVILGVTGTQELVVPLSGRLGHPKWRRALEDAGIEKQTTDQILQRMSDAYVPWQQNSFPGLLGNVVAGRISNRLNLGGTNCVVDAACASSMGAVHMSLLELYSGRSDMVISGGVDTLNDIFMHMCFSKTMILSPTGDTKPFSSEADGVVLGEGIGMVVLKRLDDAVRDRDNIYAVIKSLGTSSDGRSQSIYAPRAQGQAQALQKAYKSAGIHPSTIELIEAHGTGTRVGDQVEFKALKDVFQSDASSKGHWCALGSVKSMIGHTKAASGSAGIIKAVLALHHKILPPTLKVKQPDPGLNIENSPFYLNTLARPWIATPSHPRRCGVSSFGFGGSNFHTVLEEHQSCKKQVSWDGSVEIFAISGNSVQKITQALEHLDKKLTDTPDPGVIAALAGETRSRFNAGDAHRMVLVLEHPRKPADLLAEARLHLKNNLGQAAWHTGPVSYGAAPTPGKLAFVFPGQGSQYIGMGRDLICAFPEALEALTQATQRLALSDNLTDLIFPKSFFTPEEQAAHDTKLRSTDITQPALGAVCLAMYNVLNRFGVTAQAACGHSYGELVALFAAGVIDTDALLQLSFLRGRYMAAADQNGAMLAVKAPIEKLDALVRTSRLDVVLANRNSPVQGVLSGPAEAITAAEKKCRESHFRAIRLPVSAAFHSRLVKNAQEPFVKALEDFDFRQPEIPVFSNTSALPYPGDPKEAKTLLGRQILCPVDFMGVITNMHDQGVRTFVEVGPKTVLTGLVKTTLKGREFTAMALDASSGRHFGIADLARFLGQLAALGYPVALDQWEAPPGKAPRQKLMRLPVCGANLTPSTGRLPEAPGAESKKHGPSPAPSQNRVPDKQPMASVADPLAEQGPPDHRPALTTGPLAQRPNRTPEDMVRHHRPFPMDLNEKNADTGKRPKLIHETLKIVQEGLKSMEALQRQTAETHKIFLETQTQAGRTLQEMMHSMQAMAETVMGGGPSRYPDPAMAFDDGSNRRGVCSGTSGTPDDSRPLPTPEIPAVAPHPEKNSPDCPIAEKPSSPDPAEAGSAHIVSGALLEIVSDLTGYPAQMLGMDMDMEADLGIDSIKRVEILSALEEKYPALPAVAPETMGRLKTLGQIAEHLSAESGTPHASDPAPAENPPAPPGPGTGNPDVAGTLLEIVSDLTGYPAQMLGMDMNMEADLGIDSIKRVEILSALEEKCPFLPAASPETMGRLKTLGQIAEHLSAESGTPHASDPAPAENPPAPPGPGAGNPDVAGTLLEIVSDLTGYPVQMLGMDMDMEADLGIDSIKRVEILSALEEKCPFLPVASPETMGRLKTLGQIAAHLNPGEKNLSQNTKKAPCSLKTNGCRQTHQALPEADQRPKEPDRGDLLRQTVAVKETPFDAGTPLSILRDRPVLIMAPSSDLSKALVAEFSRAGVKALLADDASTSAIAHAGGLVILSPESATDGDFLKQAFGLTRQCAPALLASAEKGDAFFATVSRLDGAFGFTESPLTDPLQGALAGLTKTAALEWPDVWCRALDLEPDWQDAPAMAAAIVGEVLNRAPFPAVETGLGPNSRRTLTLTRTPLCVPEITFGETDLFLVSGGGRGVTGATALELARHGQPTLILMGRSILEKSEPAWLASMTDEKRIKQAIIENGFTDESPTPSAVDKRFKTIMAHREINTTLAAIHAAGARADYFPADVRDPDSVQSVIDQVHRKYGAVTGIVHGAGILEDRLIINKTGDQFNRVFDTKVKGLINLLAAAGNDPLKHLVLFSSVAARMGNMGQADYAMANEALNKMARIEAARRPGCRVVSINWGPWDGGMVSPSLKRVFEKRKIPLISITKGTHSMLREMNAPAGSPVEVVMGAGLGPGQKKDAAPVLKDPFSRHKSQMSLTVTLDLDVDRYPILESHMLDGKPVVPFALMAEWLGHGALHENPGLFLSGIDDMRLLRGIQLDRKGKTICVLAGKPRKKDAGWEVDVEITSGDRLDRGLVHARARAILTDTPVLPKPFDQPERLSRNGYSRSISDIYDKILFHGKGLHGIEQVTRCTARDMVARILSAPAPADWMAHPLRSTWIGDPLMLDSAFQMASLWCFEEKGMVSLPSYSATYRQYSGHFPRQGMQALLEIQAVSDHKISGDFTFLDPQDRVVARLNGYEAVMHHDLIDAFKPQRRAQRTLQADPMQ